MIYLIEGKDVFKSTQEGSTIISWSGDGSLALVSATEPPQSIQIINTYSDGVTDILSSPEWRQPCKNC
jgi:hypothetical protein